MPAESGSGIGPFESCAENIVEARFHPIVVVENMDPPALCLSNALIEAQERTSSIETGGGNQGARKQQHCAHIENFFPARSWEIFQSTDLSINPKVNEAATVLYNINISCPSIPLLKRVAALIASMHFKADFQAIDPKSLQPIAKQVQAVVKSFV